MSEARLFDARRCELGEAPLWHPDRGELLWFDITGKRLLARALGEGAKALEWAMEEIASAAAMTGDPDRLLMATESALVLFDLASGARETLCALEADRPETRSNDGRADPWGGFWIGTMGKGGEEGLGAIYRWHGGDLRRLHAPVSIPNAICFDRARARAYLADTPRMRILRQALHPDTGWPEGEAELHIDLSKAGHKPDGAVTDAQGNLWNAQWGSARVACYDPDGREIAAIPLPARHSTCPAFGGPDLATLYCTSALQDLEGERRDDPAQGATYAVAGAGRGAPEPKVAL